MSITKEENCGKTYTIISAEKKGKKGKKNKKNIIHEGMRGTDLWLCASRAVSVRYNSLCKSELDNLSRLKSLYDTERKVGEKTEQRVRKVENGINGPKGQKNENWGIGGHYWTKGSKMKKTD